MNGASQKTTQSHARTDTIMTTRGTHELSFQTKIGSVIEHFIRQILSCFTESVKLSGHLFLDSLATRETVNYFIYFIIDNIFVILALDVDPFFT